LASPGRYNAITDVDGLLVGHCTNLQAVTGLTVIIAPDGAIAGVDVRGSAPGTRETNVLAPVNLVDKAQAVVLSGGSVYGLASADGVVRWLSNKGYGFPLQDNCVAPIVPSAVLYDLGRGPDFIPDIQPQWGVAACEAAASGPVDTGNVGAGTGAFSGSIKGGLGTASLVLNNGISVGAIVAVNSDGSVINPKNGRPWEIELEQEQEFGAQGRRAVNLPPRPAAAPAQNTTIGLVATDAELNKPQALKIAQMAHDGMARAIRPAHTMFDGDTVFCMATCRKKLPEPPGFFIVPHAQAVSEIGHAAADCLARAIIRAIVDAESVGDMRAFRDLEDISD
jgi:L-aminopeptidase/D-esterase-like protein